MSEKCWKIADFGLSREWNSNQVYSTHCARGTEAYQAPELLRDEAKVGKLSDIWALGCIFYQVGFGQKAFSRDWNVVEYSYSRCSLEFPSLPIPKYLNCYLREITKELLNPNWWDRPTARVVLEALHSISHPDTDIRVLNYPQLIHRRLDVSERQLRYLRRNYPQLTNLRLNFPHLDNYPQLIRGQNSIATTVEQDSKGNVLPFFSSVHQGTLWNDDGNMMNEETPGRVISPPLRFTYDNDGWDKLLWKPYWYAV